MDLPIPTPNADSRPYWDAAQQERLVLQHCTACGAVQAVPRSWCGKCQSPDLTWRDSDRRGTVASFSIVHRGPTKAFRDHLPYVLALVDVTEGVRLMLNVIGDDRLETRIGDEVEIVFEPRGPAAFKMPQAKRSAA
ncbi:MAG: Zn-ribbon domain-containing OB-fold protein [Pseudodonghicola sp.]